jgi:hypothetical protein
MRAIRIGSIAVGTKNVKRRSRRNRYHFIGRGKMRKQHLTWFPHEGTQGANDESVIFERAVWPERMDIIKDI